MKLIKVRVQKFRNIIDSTPVAIQEDITCLVGKNESGKTAFLHALYRLNPARKNVTFTSWEQYPAWLEKKDRLKGVEIDDFIPIEAIFTLEPKDKEIIDSKFGQGALTSTEITITKNYNNTRVFSFGTDEKIAVRHLIDNSDTPIDIKEELMKKGSFTDLATIIEEQIEKNTEDPDRQKLFQQIKNHISSIPDNNTFRKAVLEELDKLLPKFFYYGEYSNLPYTVKIRSLLEADEATLSDDLLTAKSLLKLACAEKDYLLDTDYERRKRELENIANSITDDVLTYWSQNKQLRVEPDITLSTEKLSNGQHTVIDELKLRIRDDRHSLSLQFDRHSTGFRWFFSFLAAFSEFELKEEPVIVLLDEPALGLHARAQADFLRFIEERLAKNCQVIYTTHSPFMVQPSKLERVRLVEDKTKELGSVVAQDVLSTDADTIFPLQNALGYDLVQHLFIGSNNLVVEGTSDYVYLTVISDYLRERGNKEYLSDKWAIVPVGGVDYVPTFVALLGNHLDVTVVIDSQTGGHQKILNLIEKGYLKNKRFITIGTVLKKKLADIEDLFHEEDYLTLFNKATGNKLKPSDIPGTDQIVSRIARSIGVERFDHGKPADYLLRNKLDVISKFKDETFDHFERLFKAINKTL